jgi:hypothetical protein
MQHELKQINLEHNTVKPLSRRKRIVFSMLLLSMVIIIIGLSAEVLTRIRGWQPLRPASNIIAMDPPGNYFAKHPTLGYVNLPGEFRITTVGPYTFKVTHLDNGTRITHARDDSNLANKNEIWIFGCSFTHGWRLNDEETFPWLVQRDLRDYEIFNFGVDGYSTVQSLIKFKESLQS